MKPTFGASPSMAASAVSKKTVSYTTIGAGATLAVGAVALITMSPVAIPTEIARQVLTRNVAFFGAGVVTGAVMSQLGSDEKEE